METRNEWLRKGWFPWIVAGAAIVAFIGVLYSAVRLSIAIGFAEGQVSFFNAMVEKGWSCTSEEELDTFVQAVRTYYPSGTHQDAGSRVDRIVETCRARALAELRLLRDALAAHSNGRMGSAWTGGTERQPPISGSDSRDEGQDVPEGP